MSIPKLGETLPTKNRPSRNDYPLTPAGDLGFAQALVVWQGDELDRLTAEVAELRRDAERLDFLDGNKRFKTGWEVGVAPVGLISVRGIGLGTKSIREAIDAARLGEQP